MPGPLAPTEILHEEKYIRQNRGPEIIVSSTICIALATTAVALRLLARRITKLQIKADDYMMVLALVRDYHSPSHDHLRLRRLLNLLIWNCRYFAWVKWLQAFTVSRLIPKLSGFK